MEEVVLRGLMLGPSPGAMGPYHGGVLTNTGAYISYVCKV